MVHISITSSFQLFRTSGNPFRFHITVRHRRYMKNSECPVLVPPAEVRGMTSLDRSKFTAKFSIPLLVVTDDKLMNKVLPKLKKLLFKIDNLKPVQVIDGKRQLLLHPGAVRNWNDLPGEVRQVDKISSDNFKFTDIELGYENWRSDEILKAVLPADNESVTGFSRIGHIVHVNLRSHLDEYKKLIGEVLRDKVKGCRTVVNKIQNIDNTYRNFSMELLCGEPEYEVEVKENGTPFRFNFENVYWNPRLSTEHERIVKILQSGDVLYDVFAGVGPFSVPSAKKDCKVLANDLNPESYKWLEVNVNLNKVKLNVKTFNKDGKDFILQDIKEDLAERWNQCDLRPYQIHITMNLPAMAIEFLQYFRGLLENVSHTGTPKYPLVHVYCFGKGSKEEILQLAENEIRSTIVFGDGKDEGVHFVRNVAPNKDMFRISFSLTHDMLTQPISRNLKRSISPITQANVVIKKQCKE